MRRPGTKPNVEQSPDGDLWLFGPLGYGALVNVRSMRKMLSWMWTVFTNIYGAPYKRPVVSGLINGDALISVLGTVATAEAGVKTTSFRPPRCFQRISVEWLGLLTGRLPGIFPDAACIQAILGPEGSQTQTWQLASYRAGTCGASALRCC